MPAVTPLDPIPDPEGVPPAPKEPEIRRVGPQLMAGAVVLAAALFLAIQPGGPSAVPTTTTEPPTAPPSLSASRPSAATGAFETFVDRVNRGNAVGALDLMLDELPEVVGLGTAEYPHLPSDALLWEEGRLDRENVEGFAHYVFTLPGSVIVSDCTAFGDGPRVIVVSCGYTASGGILARLGQLPETGRLYGFMVDDKVAGFVRGADVDLELWERLASWTEDNHPDRPLGTATPEGWVLEPDYTAATARHHLAMAEAMAEATIGGPRARRVPPSVWSTLDRL